MNNKVFIAVACIQLFGCTNLKYPNWQYVRIESSVPASGCVYKMQEACSVDANECHDWYKQRATKFNANTVVLLPPVSQKDISIEISIASQYDKPSSVAEYYYCNGPKNINPKP